MPARLKFNPAQHKLQGNSFALWKLPGSKAVHSLVCAQAEVFSYDLIEKTAEGFAFVPFNEGKPVFLSGEYCEDTELMAGTSLADYYLLDNVIALESKNHFVDNVAKGITAIAKGGMKKVVLARNTQWDIPDDFCPMSYFAKLCDAYPEAFVSLVSIKYIGTWIGATPECLLKVTPETLMTVALAGTQMRGSTAWSEKESEEQLWVVRYIEKILDEYQATQVDVAARRHIQNGLLEHLYTEICFKKAGVANTKLATQLLPRLHPTPAVCGMPKKEAMEFILATENFYRSYYSGFLGPINNNHQSHLYVNLRCMQLTSQGFVAYAGAGITIDSVPEKELTETENKLNNLKSFIF